MNSGLIDLPAFPSVDPMVSLLFLSVSAALFGVAVALAKSADDEYGKTPNGDGVISLREKSVLTSDISDRRQRLTALQILWGVFAALATGTVVVLAKNSSLVGATKIQWMAEGATLVSTLCVLRGYQHLRASRDDKLRVEMEIAQQKAVAEIQKSIATSVASLATRPEEPMVVKQF